MSDKLFELKRDLDKANAFINYEINKGREPSYDLYSIRGGISCRIEAEEARLKREEIAAELKRKFDAAMQQNAETIASFCGFY